MNKENNIVFNQTIVFTCIWDRLRVLQLSICAVTALGYTMFYVLLKYEIYRNYYNGFQETSFFTRRDN